MTKLETFIGANWFDTNDIDNMVAEKYMIEILLQVNRIKRKAKSELGKDLTTIIDLAEDDLRTKFEWIDNAYQVVKSGQNFKTYMADLKFKAMLESMQHGHLVRHLGTNFESDKQRYLSIHFETLLKAENHDMEIIIDNLPSLGTLQIEKLSENPEASETTIYNKKMLDCE